MALVLADPAPLYNKVKGLKKEDIDNLMKWCQMQPHLPELTEMQIIFFLHSNNFSNEAAKKCIDDFYTVKAHCPEFFSKRSPQELNLTCVTFFPFKEKTPEGYSVILSHLIDTNPDNWHLPDVIKVFDMRTMLYLNLEGPSEGQVFVHDLSGITFAHVAKLNLLLMKKYFFYLQECTPVRIKGLHFINIGNVMDLIMSVIKPFMKKELLNVFHTHSTMDTIYKVIPKELFPKDYPGGLAPTIDEQQRASAEALLANAAFFSAEEKQVINEQLRPGKPKNAGDIFGIEGTFKKLDLD